MSVCEWADCWVLATDWTSSGVSQRREGCGSAGYPLLTPALWCGVGGLLYGGKGGGGHACQGRWVDSVFSRKVLSLRGWAWITHTPPPASHSSCHTHTHRDIKSRTRAWPPFSCGGERLEKVMNLICLFWGGSSHFESSQHWGSGWASLPC